MTWTSTSSPRLKTSWIGGLTRGRFPGRRRRPRSAVGTSGRLPLRRLPLAIASDLLGIVASLAEVLRFDVADVEEPVAADAEVDEGGLDARFQVDDAALVDIARVVVLAGSFNVQFFEQAVLHDRNPAFFRLRDVDQDFLLHRADSALCWSGRSPVWRPAMGRLVGPRGSKLGAAAGRVPGVAC